MTPALSTYGQIGAMMQSERQDVVLTPETSQELLSRLLARAGAKIVVGAIVVEWEDDRDDIVIFANGTVRELKIEEQSEKARRIVEAAHGRTSGPGHLGRDEGQAQLPEGESDKHTDGPWQPYKIDPDGTYMAWDEARDRFDARFTWASAAKAQQRCNWLNMRTVSDGTVWDRPDHITQGD